ncbi:hypothetical protein J3Q64DRAFT_1769015 [Phycomyces blakesleeanus]|uniref:SUI1 domain-containing protein n=2 Tax=Phycomyces blakesleeanus TaxID=4837 RepID=A0A167LGH4_PHYB8|nr:hypothetical protein PHYBLDRAFT_70683 [Phycomyces blakesleeanus NRRL 1555(-)]OAD70399.1 hypothetical protein PHYBLDRAFT_70683 [Phycomyces blakesleeanus NRRL 1555(-)]|eukprot:XP_018288439.1 hypothetical protein PHYBLDRAFT_70683 [Phycomyces blakesleeanus NRRL 1555(-)]
MFKKPLSNLKSFSPLRSSDRRRFQNEAYDTYPKLKEQSSQEGASQLMPDPLQSAKFSTHIETPGIVYVADKIPWWIKLDQSVPIPTVYTMWQHPDMLPILYTWGPVVNKLTKGADLMIPGLVAGPDGTLPVLAKGDLVAITIKGYQYPLAVGTMALPTSEIKPRSGMKGKAVHIIHVYQDYLWTMGDKSDPPDMRSISDDEYESETEDAKREPTESTKPTKPVKPVEPVEPTATKTEEPAQTLSTSEIDALLRKSLFQALQFKITPERAADLLPMAASMLYASYVLPSRPRDSGEVDIKKSSWKKVQKFLKTIEKEGVLKLKEQRGETMLASVNWSHPCFQGLRSYKTLESSSQATQTNSDSLGSRPASGTCPAATPQALGPIEIQDFYKPLGNSVVAFFDAAKQPKDAMYSPAQVRQLTLDYIKQNNLVNQRNQKMVTIDAILCDCILTPSEYNTIDALTRDQIVSRLLDKMAPFHSIAFPGKNPTVHKGNPKPIEITQEIRQGRKTVTKLAGFEGFGLDMDELCKELTKLCASSVTHNPIHGTSPKNPMHEIMVQGPQIKNVSQLVMDKGVPKRFVCVNDKTAKGKGKK